MKTLVIALLAILSVSASAKVCEVGVQLAADASKVKLYLEDKENGQQDHEQVVALMGGNPKNLSCEDLIFEIKKSGKKTVELEGIQIPLQVIHTFDL